MQDWKRLLFLAGTLALGVALAIFLVPLFLGLLALALLATPILRWYVRRKGRRPPPGVIDAEYEIR